MAYTETTGIGCRYVYVARRDDDGTFKILGSPAPGTAYCGIRADRARALTITPAEPQRISARGDDVTYYTFQASPTDTPTGELRTQQSDTALVALITGVSDFGSGLATMVPISSDKLGTEDPVMIWGSRMAIQSGQGLPQIRVWETYIILNASAFARPQPFEVDNIGEFTWTITANNSSADQFGRIMSQGVHGCIEAAIVFVKTRYKFFLDVFEGDGAQDEFTLTQGANTIRNDANSPIFVFVNGVATAKTVSALGVVTIAPAPALASKIVVQSEYFDS